MFGYICQPNIRLSETYIWISLEMFIVARVMEQSLFAVIKKKYAAITPLGDFDMRPNAQILCKPVILDHSQPTIDTSETEY